MFANIFLRLFKRLIPMGSAIVANYPKLRELILVALSSQIGREQLGALLSSQSQNSFEMSSFPPTVKGAVFLKNTESIIYAAFSPGEKTERGLSRVSLKNLLANSRGNSGNEDILRVDPQDLVQATGLLLFSDTNLSRASIREVLYWCAKNSSAGVIAFTEQNKSKENDNPRLDLEGNISVGLSSHGVCSIFIPQAVLATPGFTLPEVSSILQIVKHLKDFAKGKDVSLFSLKLGGSLQVSDKGAGVEVTSKANLNILVVQPIWTGGLKITSDRLYGHLAKSQNVYVLKASGTSIDIVKLEDDNEKRIYSSRVSPLVQAWNHYSSEYDTILARAISILDIDIVHVEHLAWQSLGLADVSRAFRVPIVFSTHDFYSVCASHTLLDENLNPCFGKCLPGVGACSTTIWPISSVGSLKNADVRIWREMFLGFLSKCATVISPSHSVAKLLNETYPSITRLRVIEHPKPQMETSVPKARVEKKEPIKVLVIGDISLNKGALLIKKIHDSDANNHLEFHFVGSTWPGIQGFGVHHGSYKISELASIVERINPDVGLVPAIGQETYSLTLSEFWTLGIPVVASNYGALSERIDTHRGGLSATPDKPETWISTIESLAWDSAIRDKAILGINSWQKHASENLDIETITKLYLEVFVASIDMETEQIA
jgi:glycosyltransferase involved in cell wall biosynthesis